MTKISQLTDLGAGLAAGDEFIVRDVSDVSTPNKKVTASGFANYIISQGTGSGFAQIAAGAGPLAQVLTTSSGTTGTVTISTASAGSLLERLRIDSSGRFGIGTTAPQSIFEIYASLPFQSITGTGTGEYGLKFLSGAAPSAHVGGVAYNSSSGELKLAGPQSYNFWTIQTNNAERARIDTSGRLLVGTSTANTSGAKLQTSDGLTFPATAVASADPNTLDDYEEGTWTPTLRDGLGGTGTLSEAYGKYTKIGRSVFVQVHTTISSTSGLTSNQYLYIGGAPFTCASLNSTNLSSPNFSGVPFSGYVVTTIANNQAEFSFSKVTSNATATPHLVSDFATGDVIQFSGWYMV